MSLLIKSQHVDSSTAVAGRPLTTHMSTNPLDKKKGALAPNSHEVASS